MAIWHKTQWVNIGSVVSNPEVVQLHSMWQTAHANTQTNTQANATVLPGAQGFQVADLPQLAPRLMLLEMQGQDFRYLHYGSDIARHSQFDMTGRMVSEFGGEVGEFFMARYLEVLRAGQPLYTVHYADRAKTVLTWERLILPLSAQDGSIQLLVYNTPLESRLVLLEGVLNATNDGILALRPVLNAAGERSDWLILVANALAVNLLGGKHAHPTGFNVSDVFDNWDALGMQTHCNNGLASANGIEFVLETHAASGEPRHLAGRTSSLGDGCVIRLNDITQQRMYENLLWDARQQAESASMAKANFLATMSHEIRTPMNGIIGMTSLLLETTLSPDQQEFTDVIRSSSESLLVVVNDILDFSKIESGNMQLEWVAVDLRETVESSLDLMALLAQKKNIELVYFIESDVPHWIFGDATRLRQVLVNLISNALKFTQDGTVFVLVKLATNFEASTTLGTDAPKGDALSTAPIALEISVTDSGIGIAKDKLQRLFLPFSQVDASTSRKFGGTGLGLAICKRLVEAMGGRIWVESEEGQGARFAFTLRSEIAPAAIDSVVLDSSNLQGRRVLLVDDNATNLRILTLQTQRWGMLCEAFPSPELALECLASGQEFDLCITDMHMPNIDGLQFLQKARLHAPQLQLVLLSSVQIAPSLDMALFSSTLVKPARQSALFDALMQAASQRPVTPSRVFKPAGFDPEMALRHPLRLLLVEDNEINTKVALRLLGGFGYRADVAADGLEALQALMRQPYDVVLMDIQMPRMDGLEATQRMVAMHADKRLAQMPRIIGMSANALQSDMERAFAAGMHHYVTKPITVAALADALATSLRLPASPDAAAQSIAAQGSAAVQLLDAARVDPLLEVDPSGEFLSELTESFQTNAGDLLRKMQATLAAPDTEELARLAHQLKGLGASLGVAQVAQTCADIETIALRGRTDEVLGLIVRAASQLDAGIRALRARVAQLRA